MYFFNELSNVNRGRSLLQQTFVLPTEPIEFGVYINEFCSEVCRGIGTMDQDTSYKIQGPDQNNGYIG